MSQPTFDRADTCPICNGPAAAMRCAQPLQHRTAAVVWCHNGHVSATLTTLKQSGPGSLRSQHLSAQVFDFNEAMEGFEKETD